MELPTIAKPDTILGWHRKLVAMLHDFSAKGGQGRPRTTVDIRELIVRMANDNPSWGYTRIMGELSHLGHTVGRTTIAEILAEHGIVPAPERRKTTTWRDFLRSHWDVIGATDFFTVDIWSMKGLVTYYVLFVIELSTRRVEIAGITPNPTDDFMAQIARNLTDIEDGFLREKRILIHDRDSKFTDQFCRILRDAHVRPLKLPCRSPNLNAFAERFVLSIKSECLDRLILFGERSLRRACSEYLHHYHLERSHQGLDNVRIEGQETGLGTIECRERLGGLLKHYYRAA